MAFLRKNGMFVKLGAVMMAIVLVFGMCACTPPQSPPTPKPEPEDDFIVTYLAMEGGHIVGNAVQVVKKGGTTQEVEAVADSGYMFVEWSDGVESAKRTDENVTEDVIVTALFSQSVEPDPDPKPDPQKTFTVTYLAGSGGHIVGKTPQTVNEGEDAEEVEAVADNGYVFVKWNDGIETAKRTDRNVTKRITVTAVFAESPVESVSLPVFNVVTNDGKDVTSKDYYKDCKISVSNAEEKYCFENKTAGIRGRGNSTWAWPKKPYKIKFDSKIDLFGNGKAKKWTLIANYCDYSMIRNYMVYSLAQEFEELSKTTTTTQFVDVYFNGRYDGVYLLCEQVETGSNRVDIEDDLEKVTDPEKLGFLLEWDARAAENGGVPSNKDRFEYDGDYLFKVNEGYLSSGTCFIIKSPDYEDAADLGLNFNIYVDHIQSYMNNALKVLWANNYNAVKEIFDVQSWAEGYIIDELFKTVDVAYSSFYMFKDDKDGKLYRGPLWDYDISSDNCNYYAPINNATHIYATRNPIYKKLLEYSEFRALVTDMLKQKAAQINATLDNCVRYVYARSDAFERNFERWPLLNWGYFDGWCPVPDHLRAMKTWKEEVEHLRSWLNKSLNYMLTQYK